MSFLGKNKIWIVKSICFSVCFICLFLIGQKLLQAKWLDKSARTASWMEFRELEPNTVDVFFVGTSHIYAAMDPMYIYENSGISSYVLSGPAMRLDMTYLALKDALKSQKPQLVLLDVSAIQFEHQQNEASCHKVLDQLPISIAKIEYAFDSDSKTMKPLDALFPFFRYHSRWEDLNQEDFMYLAGTIKNPPQRGHYVKHKRTKTEFHFYEEDEKKSQYYLNGRNGKYLERIRQLCEKNEIQLILYKVPTPEWYENQSKGAQKLADKWGVPFLDLFYHVEEMDFDPKTDFYDADDHVNQYGAEKISQFILDYMKQRYDLKDHRGEYKTWNEELPEYHSWKEKVLQLGADVWD